MKIKQKIGIFILALVLLGIALYLDLSTDHGSVNQLPKREVGEGATELELVINTPEGEMDYELEIQERALEEQEAMELLAQAKREIDETIYYKGENANEVRKGLHTSDKYAGKRVRATWDFNNYKFIDDEGLILSENLPEEGLIVSAEVTLRVQQYIEVYEFDFRVMPPEYTYHEQIAHDAKKEIEQNEDNRNIYLPEIVNGSSVKWKKKGENYFGKILFLEIISALVIGLLTSRSRKQASERERLLMKYDYSEIVGKYGILLGAGMSTKQVWYNISALYLKKRNERKQMKRGIYEEMLKTYYELRGGAYEAEAYLNFGKRVHMPEYNRFIRLINQTNTKGARGVSALLQAEATGAFGERVALARKLGEEASTKLLFPMLLMMMVLFAIIIAPAIIEFMG